MEPTRTICFVITNDVYTDQRIQRSRDALISAGYEVTVFYRNIPGMSSNVEYGKGITMWFNDGPLFYLEFNIRAFVFLLLNSFEILTSVDVDSILCCRLAAWIKGKPLVFDAHEYFIHVPELLNHPFKRRVWTIIEKLFVRNLSAAYTVNNSLADVFTERYGIPFKTVRNVPSLNNIPNPGRLKTLPVSEHVVLIYQGAINEGRGIEIYLEAIEHLPNCELWLVGKGDLTDTIHQKILKSNSKNRIKLWGVVAPDDLPELTAKAHIGLNLLDPKSKSYFFSLANRYYDYAKAGIPSIHMDFPEYRIAMNRHHTGILVDHYSLKGLLEAIRDLLSDHERYKQMSKDCLNAAEENNWELEKEKLLSVYNSI